MLRGLLGDENWWKGIRNYAARNKYQVVETDDFRKAMEEASGKDLKWFFDQWLSKAGHPELKVRWHYEDADKTVRVKIEQTQKLEEQTPLFRLPTKLEITEAVGKVRAIPVVIDGANQEFVIPCDVKPRMVQIDRNAGWSRSLTSRNRSRSRSSSSSTLPALSAGSVPPGFWLVRTRPIPGSRKPSPPPGSTKIGFARTEMVTLIAGGPDRAGRRRRAQGASQPRPPANEADEAFRSALAEAAQDTQPRVRVAALSGLARLKHRCAFRGHLPAAWANPHESYGARNASLRLPWRPGRSRT